METEGIREMKIEHMTHPEHPLVYVAGGRGCRDFMCDGCNQPGNGCRYVCYACDFDLHQHCATCPPTFSFASHDLKLVCNDHVRLGIPICDVCGTDIDGLLLYRCEKSNFDVHPLCSQLPELMRHRSHPDHLLRLQPLSFGTCPLCKTLCTAASWGYRCQLCDFNLHLRCLSKSPQMNSFSFQLKSPYFSILLVVLLAFMVALMLGIKDRRSRVSYSVHSVYYHRRCLDWSWIDVILNMF